VKSICDGLKVGPNKTLGSLNVSQNEVTSEGLIKLHEALLLCSVTNLNVSMNPIRNKGAKIIADIIMKGSMINLDTLNISECEFTWEGATYLY
jgi:Leucine Rich repeat